MILSERRPVGVIKAELLEKNFKKVMIVACNGCARFCETGGEAYLNELSERLIQDGFEIKKKLVPMLCDVDMIKKVISRQEVEDVDCIITLGCVAGEYAIRKLFPDKPIIEGADTIGMAIRDERGDIFLVKDLRESLEDMRRKILKY